MKMVWFFISQRELNRKQRNDVFKNEQGLDSDCAPNADM
jgi:hypothetical protein